MKQNTIIPPTRIRFPRPPGKMLWIDAKTIPSQHSLVFGFQSLVTHESSGMFWVDQVRSLKQFPEKQLAICIECLPLPAAFIKAAIAIRAIIRSRKKTGVPCLDYVELLYRILVVDSYRIDYAPRLKSPGYNVVETTPGSILWNMDLDYNKIGYNRLKLANQGDKKLFEQEWGKPSRHSTLHIVCKELWNHHESICIDQRKRFLLGN